MFSSIFSASGVTAGIAKAVAEGSGADAFEIRPEIPYSDADLRGLNPMARCNREKLGKRVLAPPKDIAEVRNAYEIYDCMESLDPYSVDDLLKAHGVMVKGLVDEAGELFIKI